MKTWTSIRKPNMLNEEKTIYKPGKLIAADDYGHPIETGTSLMDLGRRIVEVRREARKSQEVLDFAVLAQVKENQSLRKFGEDLDNKISYTRDMLQEEIETIAHNISILEQDLNDIKVIDDLRVLGNSLNSLKKRVILNEDARLQDVATLYKTVQDSVYLEKKKRLLREVEAERAYRKLSRRLKWLMVLLVGSYGLLIWSLLV